MLTLILSSFIIGISIAAPVGPIGVLVIRRTLANGRINGLVSGLGAATADGFYGFVAAFGLSAISSLLIDNVIILRIVGGVFLLYLGIKTLLTPPSEKAAETKSANSRLFTSYASIFVLTITNPMTILAFLGIFAGLGADIIGEDRTAAVMMVIGVFLGSAVWWLLLSAGVSLFRERINPQVMVWINRLSGIIIVLFALRILSELLISA
jgi:threonine/homoserine/homoserine lactone efflux protein